MIIPSIDLMNGASVQLVGGKEHALDAGDPRPLAQRFGRVGEVAVVDLDAALGQGSNREATEDLLALAPCRVGGGIRTRDQALRWLDAGAVKIVIGTAAKPELLRELPRDRVIVALDCDDGDVVVEGWQRKTGRTVLDCMAELQGLAGGFLVTFVEREGRLDGTDLERVEALVDAAGDARVTIAGGVTTPREIAALDQMGADAQVGMALYTQRMDLAEAFTAPLSSAREDGLWPTVIVDELGVALGLAWSSGASVREALATGRGVYQSRKRGLWVKGLTSGDTQTLVRVQVDCDRDALRFIVQQKGTGFCHTGTRSCWGPAWGLDALARRLTERLCSAPDGSYTKRLLEDSALLRAKLLEEAEELADARTPVEVAHETADVLYFALVALARGDVSLHAVAEELDRRALGVTRRSLELQ